MTVGEKIQYYRKKIRLSQEELGQKMLVSRQTVSLWEMDKTLPTVDNLLRLKEIFGVSIDDILCKEGLTEVTEAAPAPEARAEAYEEDKEPSWQTSFRYYDKDVRLLGRSLLLPLVRHAMAFLSLSLLLLFALVGAKVPEVVLGVFWGLFPAGVLFFGGRILFALRRHRARTVELLTSDFSLALCDGSLILTVTAGGKTVRKGRFDPAAVKLLRVAGRGILLDVAGERHLLLEGEALPAELADKKQHDPLFPFSVNLFIQCFLSLPLAALFAALFMSEDAGIPFWSFFLFLPIPLTSVIFGFYRRAKRLSCTKNLVAGFLLAAILFLYGMLSFLPTFVPPVTPGGGEEPDQPMKAAEIAMVDGAHPIHVDGKPDEAYLNATPLIMDTFASTAAAFQSYGIARFVWSPTENAIYCFIIVNDADVGPAKYDCNNLCDAPWRADSVELLLDFSESGTVPAGGWGPYAEQGLRLSRGRQYRIDGYTGNPTFNLVEEPEQFALRKPNWRDPSSGQAPNVFNSTYRLNEETKRMENLIESTLTDYLGWEWSADDTKIGWGHQKTAHGYTAEFRVECTDRVLAVGDRVFFDIQGNDMYESSREAFYGANIVFYYTSSMRRQIGSLHSAASRPLYDYVVLTDTVAKNEVSYGVGDTVMYDMGMKDLTVTEPTA